MTDANGFRDEPPIRERYYGGRPFKSIKPWEYPDCPDCGVEIYVRIEAGTGRRFECCKCETTFTVSRSEIQRCVDVERNERAARVRRSMED